MWQRVHRGAVAAIVAALLLPGCLAGLTQLIQGPYTTRSFACAVLGVGHDGLVISVLVEDDLEFSPVAAADRLRDALADVSRISRDSMEVHIGPLPQVPDVGWTDEGWQETLAGHASRVDASTVRLSVFWVRDLGNGLTGSVPGPGVVAVSHEAVREKANTLGWDLDDAAGAVLLHHVGHALGQVNRGIPMQANHEGAPYHDDDPESVMHVAWDDPWDSTVARNATYDAFGATVVADWTAAMDDDQVCT